MNAESPPSRPCPICRSTSSTVWATARDVEYRTTDDEFTYRRCEECTTLFIDPLPDDRLEEIYPPTYYSFSARDGSLVHRVKDSLDRRMFASLTGNLTGETLRVLDVGGGVGHELSVLRSVDERVSFTQVVDIDPAAAAAATAAGHAYFCGRIEEFTSRVSFDLILMLNLIEHVADPVAVLAKARGLLTPGGRVVVKTPNVDSLDARLFRHRNWGGFHCPRHWVLFTHETFVQAALKAGLKVTRYSYTQGAPFWAVSVLAQLEQLGLTPARPGRPVHEHPLYGALAAVFAGVDFARGALSKRSQMVVVLSAADRR